MGKRANIRATAVNTAAIAESNAEMAKQARRDQLAAEGLIDFNVTDGVVRAVERRLALERGVAVTPIGDPTGPSVVAVLGAVMFIVGLILAFAGVGTASFWLLLIGCFMVGGGISNINKIEGLRRDEAELEAFEETRAHRRRDIIASALPPQRPRPVAPAPPALELATERTADPVLGGVTDSRPPVLSSPRRHQRGMRRPTPPTPKV